VVIQFSGRQVQKRAIKLTLRSSTTPAIGRQVPLGRTANAEFCVVVSPYQGDKRGWNSRLPPVGRFTCRRQARFAFYPIVTPIISKETLSSTKELIV
jgi:hypothetical protein